LIDKNELLKLLPKLIREDDEIKGAIITALSGVVATKDDIARMIDNSNRRFEATDKRLEKLIIQMNVGFGNAKEERSKGFGNAKEERSKGFGNAKEERRKIKKSLNELKAAVGSIGDRSGKALEDTIIELLNDKLIQENIQASKIHKEIIIDKEGVVFTKYYSSDIDVLIENGKIILIDIKYHADNNKIFNFLKRAELYTRIKKPYDQLIIITLEIEKKHLDYANQLGIKIISGKIIE
jgi:hypothetical protein